MDARSCRARAVRRPDGVDPRRDVGNAVVLHCAVSTWFDTFRICWNGVPDSRGDVADSITGPTPQLPGRAVGRQHRHQVPAVRVACPATSAERRTPRAAVVERERRIGHRRRVRPAQVVERVSGSCTRRRTRRPTRPRTSPRGVGLPAAGRVASGSPTGRRAGSDSAARALMPPNRYTVFDGKTLVVAAADVHVLRAVRHEQHRPLAHGLTAGVGVER